MKVVLLKASPWPLPRGLMRHTGTVLEVSESEAGELREHGLIAGTGNVLNLPQPSALQSVAGM